MRIIGMNSAKYKDGPLYAIFFFFVRGDFAAAPPCPHHGAIPRHSAANRQNFTAFTLGPSRCTPLPYAVLATLTSGATTWTDSTVQKGASYTWRVRAGKDSVTSLPRNEVSLTLTSVRSEGALPMEFSLSQNYPNPFNPSTRIVFSLPRAERTKLALYDLLGREVRTLVDQEMAAGQHTAEFDAGQLPGGVYICRMQSGDFIAARKMILMK